MTLYSNQLKSYPFWRVLTKFSTCKPQIKWETILILLQVAKRTQDKPFWLKINFICKSKMGITASFKFEAPLKLEAITLLGSRQELLRWINNVNLTERSYWSWISRGILRSLGRVVTFLVSTQVNCLITSTRQLSL